MRQTKHERIMALDRLMARLERRLTELNTLSDRLANLRLAIVLVFGGATAVVAFIAPPWAFWVGLLLTAAVFIPVTVIHRRIMDGVGRFRAWRDIKGEHLARALLDWEYIPHTHREPATEHPYEHDIDLLDVHRLLSVAESQGGRDRLYEWLTTLTPDPTTIAERQRVVRELIPRSLYRDRLAMVARLGVGSLRGTSFEKWLREHTMPPPLPPLLAVMALLAVMNWVLFGLFLIGALPPFFVGSLVLYAAAFVLQTPYTLGMFRETTDLVDRLRMLTAVTNVMERASYAQSPGLREVVAAVLADQPSADLRRLSWLAGAAGLQGNVYVWFILNALVPWDAAVGVLLYRQKAALADRLPRWLEVWYTVEALSSLAGYAARNPAATFPMVTAKAEDVFAAENIGHPLIPDGKRISNDFRFSRVGEVVIITGSNMSGKSSFLRTLGVNLRMAYAGGAVCAAALTVKPMRLFSSIRVTDSLEDGISFFYAEVKRLRALLDAFQAEGELPLFFLIDEIFRGTNNRERLLGSRAYVEALVGGNGVGLIATHDLELVTLADSRPLVRNMHFREEVSDGRMVFDYVLRPGPCPTTNALTIMAMEGLPVPARE